MARRARRPGPSKVTWNAGRFTGALLSGMEQRMAGAVNLLKADVQASVSRWQPTKIVGGKLRGLDPSKPGEPPKIVTGDLRKNILSDVRRGTNYILGIVGVNKIIPYARRLEYGFHTTGTTADDPTHRPYLRPALHRLRGRLYKYIIQGR